MVLQHPSPPSAASWGPAVEIAIAGWPGLHDVVAAVARTNGGAARLTIRDEATVPPPPAPGPGSPRTLVAIGPAAAFDVAEPGASYLAGWDGVVTADAPLEAAATLAQLLGVSYLPELPIANDLAWRLSDAERETVRAAAAAAWDGTVREMVAALGHRRQGD